MLVQLTVEQITEYWPDISKTFEAWIPKTQVLEELMTLRMQCWLVVPGDEIKAVILTRIEYDSLLRVNQLLIYWMYSFGVGLSGLPWREGLAQLFKYAASRECSNVIVWTENPHLADFLIKVGGSTRQLITLPLTKKEVSYGRQ